MQWLGEELVRDACAEGLGGDTEALKECLAQLVAAFDEETGRRGRRTWARHHDGNISLWHGDRFMHALLHDDGLRSLEDVAGELEPFVERLAAARPAAPIAFSPKEVIQSPGIRTVI